MNMSNHSLGHAKARSSGCKGVYVRTVGDFRKNDGSWSRSHNPLAQSAPRRSRTCSEGPFGELLRATGPMAKVNPFRFSTKYQDDETDLRYYGYRYYSTSTGRWISRDPIEENGGRCLYGFNENDGVNKSDYLGQMVGSVNVLKNNPLSALLAYGWELELEWRPPPEWNDPKNFCAPCRRAVWIQEAKYDIEFRWPWGPDIHTGWGVDWDETDFAGSAYEWRAGRSPAGKNSWMHDEPQVSPSFRIKEVFFMAVARVKCVEGSDHGMTYATVTWWYQKPISIPSPFGGYISVPVGGILSIQ